MVREQTASTYDMGKLLSVIATLSPQKVRMVTLYAENLRDRPVSDTGGSYIGMLLEEDADSDAILAAAQAIHDVDARLARETNFRSGLDDLHRRTEDRFRSWCRERGIDYDALGEEGFADLIEEAVRRVREEG